MKQSNLQSTATAWIRSIEETGAAREREKYQKSIDRAISRIQDGVKLLLDLLEPPAEKPQTKKRKAVEASEGDIAEVQRAFEHIPGGTVQPLLPKNIGNLFNPKMGNRTIALACRVLADRGVLEAVGRKGYRLAPRKENGLDETMPTRTPAE